MGVLLSTYSIIVAADHPTVAFGIGSAGPINTIAANSLPSGSWGFGVQTEIIDNDAYSTEQLEDFASNGMEGVHSVNKLTNTSFSVSYGVTDKWSVSARLPYIQRKNIRESELELGVPEAHTHGDSSGYGDLLLLGQYQITNSNSTNISGIFGIKPPTGETDVKDDDGVRFETEFQPGTGSWDVFLGGAISKNSGKLGYHANILYNKTNGGSQSTEIGDAFSYNVALTYRLNGDEHTSHNHSHDDGVEGNELQWDLIVELNGDTRSKNKISGVSEDNSGGTLVFISPGFRVTSGAFSGFLSIGIPVIEDQNGKQTDIDKRITAGISFSL